MSQQWCLEKLLLTLLSGPYTKGALRWPQVSADQWWDVDDAVEAPLQQQAIKTRAEWDS